MRQCLCARRRIAWLLLLLAILLLCCSACDRNEEDTVIDDPIVITPGVQDDLDQDPDADEEEQDEAQEEFPDKGTESDVNDLVIALSKVQSYYYEKSMPYVDGTIDVQVWYYDGKMKYTMSDATHGDIHTYYDYQEQTRISYTPAMGNTAVKDHFSIYDEDLPAEPKSYQYYDYTVHGFETVDGQTCMMLETPSGDMLWISTRYGFPLQERFTDPQGDVYTVALQNLSINTVSESDVTLPDGVELIYE